MRIGVCGLVDATLAYDAEAAIQADERGGAPHRHL